MIIALLSHYKDHCCVDFSELWSVKKISIYLSTIKLLPTQYVWL